MAAEHHGVIDAAELAACGLSANAVVSRRRRGLLHAVHPGVYAWGHPGLTLHGRFLAAVKAAGPGAALSHRSSAVMWRLLLWDEAWLPEVTIPMRGARAIPGIMIRRTRVPFTTINLDGIPVTTPARTLIDLSSVLPFDPLRRAVREAMARKRVTMRELVAIPGKPGGAKLARIIASGYVPTVSELEDVVHALIERAGLPTPIVNRRQSRSGLIPDFRWPDKRVILEADSRTWHDNPLARQDDERRQARLEADGERVLRVTWEQAVAHPDQTIARLKAALSA